MTISPKTRSDIDVRDAIRRTFSKLEHNVSKLVAEKTAEGFSLDDIAELYSIKLPVLLGCRYDNGRILARYGIGLLDRSE